MKEEIGTSVPWTISESILVLIFSIIITQLYTLIGIAPIYGLDIDIAGNTWIMIGVYLFQNIVIGFCLWAIILKKYGFDLRLLKFKKVKAGTVLKWVLKGYFVYFAVTFFMVSFFESNQLDIPGFDQQEPYIPDFGNNPFGLSTLFIIAVFIAPIVEEVLFRGIILQTIWQKWGIKAGILFSSILFAIIHFEMQSFFPLFFLGLIMAWMYYKTDSIWTSIIFHAMNNVIAFAAEYLLLMS